MNAKKTETTKGATTKVIYSLTAITALEFETICKGLDLLQKQGDVDGCRASQMLLHLENLREGAADNGR